MASKLIKVSIDDIEEGCNGVCLACGEIQYGGCEPDAHEYVCASCDTPKVYGLEEALFMGAITLADKTEEGDTQ
jgi:hypothetical protein